ncbi:MAG: hypothetical protein M1828_004941 [Chrysothrix sp. TS-e1954]|nr:MAG: hypothetical protein M1828_004941 [Chrysothrix sp. TS-e1954]
MLFFRNTIYKHDPPPGRSASAQHPSLPSRTPSRNHLGHSSRPTTSSEKGDAQAESCGRPTSRSSRVSSRSTVSRDRDANTRPASEMVNGQNAPTKAQRLLGIEKEAEEEQPVNFAKAWLSRGRNLGHHASRQSANPPTPTESAAQVENASTNIFSRRKTRSLVRDECQYMSAVFSTLQVTANKSTAHEEPHSISDPYNVQHTVHGSAHQFSKIADTTENDLIAEFSAVRAAQMSKTVRRIRMAQQHSRNSSSDNTAPSSVPSLASESSQDSLQSSRVTSPASYENRRSIRSKGSFSQPFWNRTQADLPPRPRPGKVTPRATHSQYLPPTYLYERGDPMLPDDPRRDSLATISTNNSDTFSSHPEILTEESFAELEDVHAVSTPGQTAWYASPDTECFDGPLPSVDENETASCKSKPVQKQCPTCHATSFVNRRAKSEYLNHRSSIRSESQQSGRTIKQVHFSDPRPFSAASTMRPPVQHSEPPIVHTPITAQLPPSEDLFSSWTTDSEGSRPSSRGSDQPDCKTPTASNAQASTLKDPNLANATHADPRTPVYMPPPPRPAPTGQLPPVPSPLVIRRQPVKDPHNFNRTTIACADNDALQSRLAQLHLSDDSTRELKRPNPFPTNMQPVSRPRSAVRNRLVATTETQSMYDMPTNSVRAPAPAQRSERLHVTALRPPPLSVASNRPLTAQKQKSFNNGSSLMSTFPNPPPSIQRSGF